MILQAGGFYLPFLVTGSTYIASGIICICALPTPKGKNSLHMPEILQNVYRLYVKFRILVSKIHVEFDSF